MTTRDAGILRSAANARSAASFEGVETVAIIGAGVAGLVTARTLLALGLHSTVFERNEILGGVWADGYANFGAQAPKELYEIPDWPLPADAPNFTPGPILRTYLADYADTFGITPLIRFGVDVARVAARADGKVGWAVASRVGDAESLEDFDLVVACTGLYSNRPHMPEFPGQKTFTGEIIHNSALKSRGRVEGKRVAKKGFGKSATDAARESAAVTAETSIVFRTPHWPLPQKLAGVVPFKCGTLHRLTSALIPPYQRVSGLERFIHGPGRPVAWLFWRMVEILLFFQCRLGSRFGTRVSLVPRVPIEVDSFGESTMVPRPELYRLIREGAINAHRAEIEAYERDAVRLTDGTRLSIDVFSPPCGRPIRSVS
jgi:cation diffusion facilitator CzcD-associated flavoprotein CzcO